MVVARTEALSGHAAMLLFAALISVSFTLGDLAAPYIEPSVLTAARFALAVVIMGALAAPKIKKEHVQKAWRYPVVGGLLAGYFILMFEALRLTDPVSTGAVFTLTPIMSAIFGYLLLRQITSVRTLLALLLAAAGAIWVIFRADMDAMLGLELGFGEKIFLIGCACHALYTPMSRKLHQGEPLTVYTFFGITGGLLVAATYANQVLLDTDWATLPWIAWICIIYLGLATTAVTFFLVQYATLRLPSAKVMAYGYLVPVFIIIWEGLLGHGWVDPVVWLGAVATSGAMLMLLRD